MTSPYHLCWLYAAAGWSPQVSLVTVPLKMCYDLDICRHYGSMRPAQDDPLRVAQPDGGKLRKGFMEIDVEAMPVPNP